MSVKTYNFTADNVSKTPVTAQTACALIRVREDASVAGYPTQGYQVFAPSSTDLPVTQQIREEFEWKAEGSSGSAGSRALFKAGQVVGYIQTLVSSTTFAQVEN